jgi:hypothetical protein
LFYSGALQGNFTKVCPTGMKALPVTYSVPYGKYVSISQPDADSKASNDYTTNGQALANAQPCLYYNVATSGTFARTNCGSGDMGLSVTYTVPADTYSSSTSQDAANQLAINDKTTNGPIYANANAICVPAVTINYSNYTSTFLSATYTRSTGEIYKFKLFPGSGTVNVPQGTYTVLVSCSETYPLFNLGCLSATGSPYTFYNVNVSASTCNTLSVSLYN